jgi:hypothetical protein
METPRVKSDPMVYPLENGKAIGLISSISSTKFATGSILIYRKPDYKNWLETAGQAGDTAFNRAKLSRYFEVRCAKYVFFQQTISPLPVFHNCFSA